MSRIYDPLVIARQFLFVREAATQNTGQRVEAIQRWSGGEKGTSWCCYFATMILDLCYQGASPVPRQGACQGVYQLAIANGWLTDTPVAGDVFVRLHADTGLAHHIGFVTAINAAGSVGTISGNTSADGTSSNGDRVAEHPIMPAPHTIAYIHLPD